MKTRLEIALEEIKEHFENSSPKVFKYREMGQIFDQKKRDWKLKQTQSLSGFINFLLENTLLNKIVLDFPHRKETRYIWGDISIYKLLIDIKPEAYFSHYTAMFFNNLTEQLPKSIYLNSEQTPKPLFNKGELEQKNIDLAFQNKPRTTSNIAIYGDFKIYLLSGKYSEKLGVIDRSIDNIGEVKFTNLERTLVDITVRPIYAGGIFEVLKAYRIAKEKVSINKLVAYLKNLDYTYPYHQAIGFYLQKSGYRETQIELLKSFPIEHKFYLMNQMNNPQYDPTWKIYYPIGL